MCVSCPLFSPSPSPFSFVILFNNSPKAAPVSALHRCHGNFRFHGLSLSFSPSSCLSTLRLFLFHSFRQHYTNSANIGATPASWQFFITRFESLCFSLPSSPPSSLSPLRPFLCYSFWQHYDNSAGVGATPASRQFQTSRFEPLFFSLSLSL